LRKKRVRVKTKEGKGGKQRVFPKVEKGDARERRRMYICTYIYIHPLIH
jgi:hypothetical protein